MAAPTAATPHPTRANDRRGSLPASASRGAAIAAAAHAYTMPLTVCVLDAMTIGIKRYRTTIASTDQTACAMAEAAGGAVTAVFVTHECSGHKARRPATPTNNKIDATTSE